MQTGGVDLVFDCFQFSKDLKNYRKTEKANIAYVSMISGASVLNGGKGMLTVLK